MLVHAVLVEDLSTNGVWINGERIPKATVWHMKVGDTFGFSESAMMPDGSKLPTYTLEVARAPEASDSTALHSPTKDSLR